MKRLLVFWPGVSGYTAACFSALAKVPGIDLKVVIIEIPLAFRADVMNGFSYRLLPQQELASAQAVESLVAEYRPDVLYIPGWSFPTLRRLVRLRRLAGVSKWIGVDTPWQATWRQQLGRVLLRRYMSSFDQVFVPGERGFQYMRRLGVPEGRIRKSLLAVDYDAFSQLHEQRLQRYPEAWPQQFLYVGRYVPAKGLPLLVEGYRQYRSLVPNPWPLVCVGSGPEQHVLLNQPGVEDRGFKQPHELGEIMLEAGVLVLASSFEPWGLVVPEAMAAGLPVICSEAVGAGVELVRAFHNGIVFPTGDPRALARAMLWTHHHRNQLAEMGRNGKTCAAAYSAQCWAVRWSEAARECGRVPHEEFQTPTFDSHLLTPPAALS